MDGQTDVRHINLIGGLVTRNPPKKKKKKDQCFHLLINQTSLHIKGTDASTLIIRLFNT